LFGLDRRINEGSFVVLKSVARLLGLFLVRGCECGLKAVTTSGIRFNVGRNYLFLKYVLLKVKSPQINQQCRNTDRRSE
jgi:hypothetical protein